MEAYKIVKEISPSLYKSLYAEGIYKVIYEKNKLILSPDNTLGLFCYKDIHSAMYMKTYTDRVFLVEGDAPFFSSLVYSARPVISLDKYYKLRRIGINMRGIEYSEPDTILFQSLTLIKEYREEEYREEEYDEEDNLY